MEDAANLTASLNDDAAVLNARAARIKAFAANRLVTAARGNSDHTADYAGRLAASMLGLIPVSLPPSVATLEPD